MSKRVIPHGDRCACCCGYGVLTAPEQKPRVECPACKGSGKACEGGNLTNYQERAGGVIEMGNFCETCNETVGPELIEELP